MRAGEPPAYARVPFALRANAWTKRRAGNVVAGSRMPNVRKSDVNLPSETTESASTIVPAESRTS